MRRDPRALFMARREDASGSIYGTIVVAGTIVGAAEATHSILEIAETVIVTLVIYWVAHAYAEARGHAIPAASVWVEAGHELIAESTMITACILPVAALLVASALGADFEVATSIALWFAVAALFAWGLVAAHRTQLSGTRQLLSGVVFGLLGVVVVGLKTVIVH